MSDDRDRTNPGPSRVRRVTQDIAGLPWQVEQLLRAWANQESLNLKLNEGLHALNMTLQLGLQKLDDRIKIHDEDRKKWQKISAAVMTAIAVAIFTAVIERMRNRP